MNSTSLTELEGCVVAVIQRLQPCTGYEVRMQFQRSLTASWRASTGAIYPLLRKLTALGLIETSGEAKDKRGTRSLTVTKLGREALRMWLEQPPANISAPVADPIRTRSYLLSGLDRETAHMLVSGWRQATLQYRELIREERQSLPREERIETLALRGTELQLGARLAWLDELIAEFEL